MAVYRNRSTIRAPEALSISYLIGSPPTGTSTTTLTSLGGSRPTETASRRMQTPMWNARGGGTSYQKPGRLVVAESTASAASASDPKGPAVAPNPGATPYR